MKKNISERIKTVSNFWWIFLAVVCIGIFLRTYHFHDWLRFNADQGRDSTLVSSVVDGKAAWPLLGPKAGGTEFKLGPAFYYLEIVSAKIFGNYPDKMAYPDLLTGILSIPLLYFFLRKYFSKELSLSLTAIFAVSNYAIRYARFAWNPNSTPFWSMLALYAIIEVLSDGQKRKFLWSVVAGVAIGIGVQLHTTLLLFLPITTIIVFGYLAYKKRNVLQYFFAILAISLFLNVPQIVHEYQHKGENINAFFGGIKKKQSTESSLLDNAFHGTSCWVQTNADIISGYEIADKCSFTLGDRIGDSLVFVLGFVFVFGGMFLGYKFLIKEEDFNRKLFLAVVATYTSVVFVIFIKLAFELSVRFYLILIFLPFLLLGFWLNFLKEKNATKYLSWKIAIVIFLILSNLFFVQKYYSDLSDYGSKNGGNIDVTILSETEFIARFIESNANGKTDLCLNGDGKILFKAFKSIKYLVEEALPNTMLTEKNVPAGESYFYLGTNKDRDKLLSDPDVSVEKYANYGELTIMLVQNNVISK